MDGNSWVENIKINNYEEDVKIDTGGEINVMPLSLCKKIKAQFKRKQVKN